MLAVLKPFIPGSVLTELSTIPRCGSLLTVAHFLSQCAHESKIFRRTEENLNYSDQALRSTFPSHFTAAQARDYQRQPQRIASRAYANRMGNGDEASGDGYTFRGRGYLQLTGKDNYIAFGNHIGVNVVGQPDLVATHYPLTSAAWFFEINGIWEICERGADEKTIIAVTQKINGGTNGLADRIALFNRYYKALSSRIG